jgi:4-amino-4-deoxy-L-arabinose transferase-like glycosyltransferase
VALSALILFGIALALRLAQLAMFPHPAYPDAFYYEAVARSVAAGHGLNVPYLWSFLDVGSVVPMVGTLPIPAGAHWMPLASLVQVPFIWLLGPTDLASMIPFALLGAALAPFTYLLVRDLAPRAALPVLAGALFIVPGYAAPFLGQPDNFALFALLAGGSLWLVGRARRDGARVAPMLAAGALAGLAYLSRTDGVLVTVAVLGWGILAWWAASRHHQLVAVGPRALAAYAAGAGLVVAPWIIRQLAVFGTISVSASSGRVLWIRTYDELFSADGPLTMSHLLSWDPGALLNSRLDAISAVVTILAGGVLVLVLVPFALVGLRRLWQSRALRPMYAYAGLFLAWSVIVAAPHLTSGNFLHSATAILPLVYAGVGVGLTRMVAGLRRRFNLWRPERTLARIAVALTLAAAVGTMGLAFAVPANWVSYRTVRTDVVTWLDANAPQGALVMSSDPGSIWIQDPRFPGIQTPNSALPVIESALSSYHVGYLLLEKQHIVSSLIPVLEGKVHPAWLSAPILSVPDPNGAGSSAATPLYVIYAVLPVPPVPTGYLTAP